MSQVEAAAGMNKSAPGEFASGWKVLAAAATGAGAGVNGVHFYAITLFLIPLSSAFAWSRTEVSFMKTFMTLGLITTAPLIGILAELDEEDRTDFLADLLPFLSLLGLVVTAV